jgi:hypothetical protein
MSQENVDGFAQGIEMKIDCPDVRDLGDRDQALEAAGLIE